MRGNWGLHSNDPYPLKNASLLWQICEYFNFLTWVVSLNFPKDHLSFRKTTNSFERPSILKLSLDVHEIEVFLDPSTQTSKIQGSKLR